MAKQMTEAECLEAIHGAEQYSARELLLSAMPDADRRFKAVDKAICDFLRDVQKHFPNAQYYTASGGFNLMLGSPHANNHDLTPQQELIALSGRASIGDGDF